MSNVRTSAGSTLGISATLPTAFTDDAVNGYPSLTYINVGEIANMGEFGPSAELVTFDSLDERVTRKRKGTINAGSMTLEVGLDDADTGQLALQTAQASDDSVAIEVELQDGTTYYFTAQVMSFVIQVGGPNEITRASVMLEIDRLPVKVAPSS